MGGRPKEGFGEVRRAVCVAIFFAAFGIATPGQAAGAALSFCPPGTGPGQCDNPQGLAVDYAHQRLYVVDRNNDRVNAFAIDEGEEEMDFLFSFGEGQLESPRSIAVDNTEASPGFHSVYVFDEDNSRVVEFDDEGNLEDETGGFTRGGPIAVAQSGEVYVAETLGSSGSGFEPLVKRYDDELTLTGECEIPHAGWLRVGLVIDAAGDLYATFTSGGGVFKFEWGEPECVELTEGGLFPLDDDLFPQPLARDDSGDLYSQVASGGFGRVITRFAPTGETLRRFGYGDLNTTIPGIAPFSSSFGEIFASEQNGPVKYLSEPPPGPLSTAHEAVPGNVRATISAEINPEGKETDYRIEYLTRQAYEEQGESFEGPATKTGGEGTLAFEDFELHEAVAEVGCPDPLSEAGLPESPCLLPDTEYRYRIAYENADGPGDSPKEGTFTTLEALEVKEAWASEVSSDSARLSGTVNPQGIPATGYFEYVDDATFQETGFENATQVPNVGEGAGPLFFGAAEEDTTRSTVVELEPGTTYHLRLLATNPLIEEEKATPEVLFSTFAAEASESCPANAAFRSGPSAKLPDCRAYELVSPLDKEGGDIIPLTELNYGLPGTINQAAETGGKFAYGTYKPFGDAEAAPYTAQYIAERGATEWSSHYILGSRGRLNIPALSGLNSEVKQLSEALCENWLKTVAEPQLAPGAPTEQANIYRRLDQSCGPLSFEAITTVPFPHGPNGRLEFQGASEDGSASLYAVRDNLTANAPNLLGEAMALYLQEEGEGPPHYVCVLPDGTPHGGACAAGTLPLTAGNGRLASAANAISADGSRVYWSTNGGTGLGAIYLRRNPGAPQSAGTGCAAAEAGKACTNAVSGAAEAIEGTTSSQFWWAAEDGSAALFTTGGTLYRYDAEAEEAQPLAEGAVGVMGASEDLARIYFASTEVLSGTNAQGKAPVEGRPNLYLEDEGTTRFVGTLEASSDVYPSLYAAITPEPVYRTSRVTADGRTAAFMSTAPLTGYDNTDAKSEEADTEVFLYDAEAEGGEGRLLCASCNPSGGRPAGQRVTRITAGNFWGAGQLPPWSSSLQPGTLLAEDGERLYFESSDALVPRDTNGAIDVYQWEAPGKGGCDESDPAHSVLNEGCVELISSGSSGGDAVFADASASGGDVFFTTAAGLVPHDYGLVDVYDAREGGGLPVPPAPAGECEGEACQSPAPAPAAPTPGSLTYQGPGDLAPPKAKSKNNKKAKRCAKGKRRVKRKGRVRCVKKKSGKAAKRHARHQRRARR